LTVFRLNNALVILITMMLFGSCRLIGPDRTVDIVTSSNKIEKTTLTPRHYRAKEYCTKAIDVIPATLLASITSLSNEQKIKLQWPQRIASYKPQHCDSFKKRGEILSDFETIFASKTYRIGFILPSDSSNEAALQTILDQVKIQLVQSGYSPDKTLVIRRVGKDLGEAVRAVAELVHIERVAILIGGLSMSHANAMAQLADQTQTPALIVNPHAQLGLTKQTMRVYPPIKRLAHRLSDHFRSSAVKTITTLYPNGANLDLYQLLRHELGGGYAFSQASYNPENPQSILNAVKSQVPRLSNSSDKPAVLILDNFRMVRHIVNILGTSLPGNKILFAGNQQWRSPALVIPREETLQGAIFVDFIGNYRNLPNSIDTPLSDNDYFTTAQAASKIDYQIIGHRLGSLGAEAARYGLSRHEIANRLQSMTNKWDMYFPRSELAFDSGRESSWPVFLFQVADENIKEI